MKKVKIYEIIDNNSTCSYVKYEDYICLHKKYIRARSLAQKNKLKLDLTRAQRNTRQ